MCSSGCSRNAGLEALRGLRSAELVGKFYCTTVHQWPLEEDEACQFVEDALDLFYDEGLRES